MTHYQTLLLNPARIVFQAPTALNPATLLLDPDLEDLFHSCTGRLPRVHGIQPDLLDRPLPDTKDTWFMDGSSSMQNGQRCTAVVVVSAERTIWAEALPTGTSAQWVELIALTKALSLGENQKPDVYTDSQYRLMSMFMEP